MSPQKDIFKLVSLRKPIDGLTIDPTEDISNSQVVAVVEDEGLWVNPANPSEYVIDVLSKIQTLTEGEVDEFTLNNVLNLIQTQNVQSVTQLATIRISISGSNQSLDTYANTEEFKKQYQELTDTWLSLKLKKENTPLTDKIESLIRPAHIIHLFLTDQDKLKEAGIIERLREARIVFPRKWRSLLYRTKNLAEKHAINLKKAHPPDISDLRKKIENKKREFVTLENEITTIESIRSKIHRTYWQWKKRRLRKSSPNPRPNYLDNSYFELLENNLSATERIAFRDKLDEVHLDNTDNPTDTDNPSLPDLETLDVVDDLFIADHEGTVTQANDACTQIKIWEEETIRSLPEASPYVASEDRPSIRAGLGDLIVARERLVGYQANEIAHIENVLAGEQKVREHERTKTIEDFTETETISETETEKDLQETDRNELQTEANKTIQEDFSVSAGVNTSGKYGLTHVNTSASVDFNHNKIESQNYSTQIAKEVVSKSVERVFESVRKLRRLTITEQIRELNTHTINNIRIEGSQEPSSFSGVYLWVEKIHEIELRHYGQRLMIEFHIPEPGVSLLDFGKPPEPDIPKPAPFKIGPNDIKQSNYLCLTKLYRARGVEPPPPQFINVGYAWSSTPAESEEEWGEDTANDIINIPNNYKPVSGRGSLIAPHLGTANVLDPETNTMTHIDILKPQLHMTVGGVSLFNDVDNYSQNKEFDFEPSRVWPQGVPISILAKGHWDKTLAAHVLILCERTSQALTEWKLRTWEKIHEGYQQLLLDYDQSLAEANFQGNELFQIQSRPAVENRQIEKNELKKWAIKTARLYSFNFNAIEQLGDFQEINPLEADLQAPIVNFFEEAFEWDQMSYFLYPYYWGRRETWKMRQQDYDKVDPKFNAFLKAGAAKVIVPVAPGFEERVLYYLDSNDENELNKIKVENAEALSTGSAFEDLWLELMINKNEDLVRGIGTLAVNTGLTLVTINTGEINNDGVPSPVWELSSRDIGRELFIEGEQYFIEDLVEGNSKQFHLNEPYKQESSTKAAYATGSVSYSPPWRVNVPISLVILSEEKEKLAGIE